MRALHEVAEYQARRRRKKRWHSVVAGLAAIVVCCTTYALILPAITMAQEAFCGKEEHTHDDSCYATELVCDREFDEVQAEGHVHDESCYTYEEVLTCGEEESEDTYHEHTDACYDEEENLICDEPEWTPGHTHTEDCYEQKRGRLGRDHPGVAGKDDRGEYRAGGQEPGRLHAERQKL